MKKAQYALNMLFPAILTLVIVGILVGVGVNVLDNMSTSVKDIATIVHESVSLSAGTATLAHDEVQSLQFFGNTTNNTDSTATLGVNANFTGSTGVIRVSTIKFVGAGPYNVSYTFLADNNAVTALTTTYGAVDDFPTWLGIIVIVLAAAVIIGMVTGSFSFNRRE